MTSFHVRVSGKLSPPDLHTTKEAAHEFFLANFPDDVLYFLEEVRPAVFSDLLRDADLLSSFRENASDLVGDDSAMDDYAFIQALPAMGEMVRHTIDQWQHRSALTLDGYVTLSTTPVKRV